MKRIFLLRHSKGIKGAFGVLFNNDYIPFAVSLENEETLIPIGVHRAKQDYYISGGYPTFEIQVSKRDRLLFHKLNWDFQSEGCIGIGESYEPIFNKEQGKLIEGIAGSSKGFEEFWKLYKDEKEIEVVVVEHYMEEECQHLLSQQV